MRLLLSLNRAFDLLCAWTLDTDTLPADEAEGNARFKEVRTALDPTPTPTHPPPCCGRATNGGPGLIVAERRPENAASMRSRLGARSASALCRGKLATQLPGTRRHTHGQNGWAQAVGLLRAKRSSRTRLNQACLRSTPQTCLPRLALDLLQHLSNPLTSPDVERLQVQVRCRSASASGVVHQWDRLVSSTFCRGSPHAGGAPGSSWTMVRWPRWPPSWNAR